MNNQEDKNQLLKTIKEKRGRIASYLEEIEPHGSRLTNLSIVFGGIASLLTAAQLALGKEPVGFLNTVFPPGVSVWQLLAVAATICSAIAAIAGAIYKQQENCIRLDSGADVRRYGREWCGYGGAAFRCHGV